MNKLIFTSIIAIVLNLNWDLNAQNQYFFEIDELNEDTYKEVISKANKDGWTLIQVKDEKILLNFSHPEYRMWMNLQCETSSENPSYLIEFTSQYRDGDFDGIDFTSSNDIESKPIEFIVDDINFKNPFSEKQLMNDFIIALKKGEKLLLKVFQDDFDVETDTQKLVLNRAITFKLNNAELITEKTKCN